MQRFKTFRSKYDKILVCSDTHYGHNRDFLYEPRGFTSPEEHNEWIDAQIEEHLTSDSLLIHLGDWGLSIGPQRIRDFMLRIPCETLTVWGNHNSGVLQLYNQQLPEGFEKCEIYPLRITPNITMMGYEFVLSVDRDNFHCRHMAPLIWDHMNKEDGRLRKALVGHSHGNLEGARPDDTGLGKMLDCGVENAKKYNGTAFFSIDEICEIMEKKPLSSVDHH